MARPPDYDDIKALPKGYFPACTPYDDEVPVVQTPSDDIDVYVGRDPNTRVFKVSEAFIKYNSAHFKEVIDSLRQSFEDYSYVRLPGESPHIFKMAYNFLACRLWVEPVEGKQQYDLMSWDDIVELWLFGDRNRMPMVQNGSCDLFVQKVKYCNELPDRYTVEHIWRYTGPGSPLRAMLVYLVRRMWIGNRKMYYNGIWNFIGADTEKPTHLIENMLELQRNPNHTIRVSAATLRHTRTCAYHIHRDEFTTCGGSEEALLPDLQHDMDHERYTVLRRLGWTVLQPAGEDVSIF